MESMGKKPRRRRSFTPEFKAEIVQLCQQGDRSAGQVAMDFDLTEIAVREWVKQAERGAGAGRSRDRRTGIRPPTPVTASPVSSHRAGAGQHGWMGYCWRSRWWRDGTLRWRRR
jgi:transposase-like protein